MIQIILLIFTIICNSANADPKAYYHQRQLEFKQQLNRQLLDNIEYGEFEQYVDHLQPSLGKFKQRYYFDDSLAEDKNSPVFFYICGESTCKPTVLMGAIRNYAKKHHAILVALEHRYYGKSMPTKTLSSQDLRHLSTQQALMDLAYFQQAFSNDKQLKGKWVAFGGSYPGSLSAYYRLQFPNLVVGALASSAPVMAKENFVEYDAHVAKVAGPQCLANIQKAVSKIESSLSDAEKLAKIKTQFGASDIKNDDDFLYLIADIAAAAVQYGMKDRFCYELANTKDTLTGYAKFANELYTTWNIDPINLVAEGATSENPDDYINGFGMRPWLYQSCTEYGYWQNANPDIMQSARSSRINLSYHHNICQRLFELAEPVNTDVINGNFYRPLFDASTSNILFTNGSTDPWSNLSISYENGNADNQQLDYYTIEGAAHCDDLRVPKESDSSALQGARNLMEKLIGQWLK